MTSQDYKFAAQLIDKAGQLTPTWWVVHRIRAQLLEAQGKPIFEVEAAFAQSIRYGDTDINQYHYANYLIRNDEYERAITQIEATLVHEEALEIALRSVRD